nr:triple gene block protein 2 [Lily virus X]
MPLTPPPDYTKQKPLLQSCWRHSSSFCTLLTGNTLPHTGDNLHSLPHGGTYCDGTKRIRYGGPHRSHVPELPAKSWALITVVAILIALHFSCLRTHRVHRCVLCHTTSG